MLITFFSLFSSGGKQPVRKAQVVLLGVIYTHVCIYVQLFFFFLVESIRVGIAVYVQAVYTCTW